MRAITIDHYGGPETMKVTEVLNPVCPEGGVLVKVVASTVNHIDIRLVHGQYRYIGKRSFPWTPGADFAGLVVESRHPEYQPEDEVFGMVDPMKGGCYAELIAVRPENLDHKPGSLSFHQAATIPLSGLTCFAALVRIGKIKTGDHIMVHGCTGGVGSMAVMFSRALHAKVTGTCSTSSLEYAKKLGVDKIIDYTAEDVYMPQRYDLVFDVHGSLDYQMIKKMLKPGGKFISLNASARSIARMVIHKMTGTGKYFLVVVKPAWKDLHWIREFVDRRLIRPHIARTVSLDELPDAFREMSEGRVNGKIVVSV